MTVKHLFLTACLGVLLVSCGQEEDMAEGLCKCGEPLAKARKASYEHGVPKSIEDEYSECLKDLQDKYKDAKGNEDKFEKAVKDKCPDVYNMLKEVMFSD